MISVKGGMTVESWFLFAIAGVLQLLFFKMGYYEGGSDNV